MRDIVQIGALMLLFAFLATRFPEKLPFEAKENAEQPPFAAFVELSPEANAALIESARTSWQVRSEARSRPSIGRLDSGVPLLEDVPPPHAPPSFPHLRLGRDPLGAPTVDAYSLLPETRGAEVPAFTVKAPPPRAAAAPAAFSTNDMISTDNYSTLKEMML